MANFDNAYSRWVLSLKIALPLIALALLSTLFMFSRQIDPEQAIPFAQVDVEQIAREQRITGAAYSGVTEDGTSFTVSAEVARPDLEDVRRMFASELRAELQLTTGESITITAGDGTIDTGAEVAMLSSGVHIETDIGYQFDSEVLEARLDASRIVSNGPVQAKMPFGTLEAGAMELSRANGNSGAILLDFKNRVKLLYDPPS